MLEYDFEQSIGYWLITAAHAYQRAVQDEVAPHGITFRQCQVLGYLALEGSLSQIDLAERMGIEPPTLVGILDRMQRDGWVDRVSCETDRRKNLIRPTAAAEPVWSQIAECGRRVRQRATLGLSDDELEVLQQLLLTVQQNLAASVTEEIAK